MISSFLSVLTHDTLSLTRIGIQKNNTFLYKIYTKNDNKKKITRTYYNTLS